MRFAVVTAFLPCDELLPVAVAADRLGYDSLSLADHVVDLESLETPYPYTPDGSRRWALDTDWPDPWVAIGAVAAVTTRLRFFTSVYVAALRNPYVVAKAVGTAAALSGGRVSLGVGVGWCREEFDLLEQDFGTRGRRTDDALALMKALWTPGAEGEGGMTEYDGEFYSAPRLTMRPHPPGPVPILVGGLSDVAYRRAVRNDGWIGDIYPTDQAVEIAEELSALRAASDRAGEPFEIIPALSDAIAPEQFVRVQRAGVTEVMTVPWRYYHGPDSTLEQKLDGLQRFHDDVMVPAKQACQG